jgi:protein gp37
VTKTKIEYVDYTWNPVTGCLHGCEYCYAEKIAKRFGGWVLPYSSKMLHEPLEGETRVLDAPHEILQKSKHEGIKLSKAPYPYDFLPTFHRYKLEEPTKIKKPQNIFVCSMADLFGDWVPDEWIKAVFEACEKAPQHRYLFLTKNPQKLIDLNRDNCLPLTKNFWFGTTVTSDSYFFAGDRNTFLSIEPIMCEFGKCENITKSLIQWVIIGAETGNRKGKIIPKREWIENIVNHCRGKDIPVFMKNNLRDIWKEPLIQEYPWEMGKEFV